MTTGVTFESIERSEGHVNTTTGLTLELLCQAAGVTGQEHWVGAGREVSNYEFTHATEWVHLMINDAPWWKSVYGPKKTDLNSDLGK